jgi:hypothetical protein
MSSIVWIPLADEKPPRGEYVLIWVPSRPWNSSSPSVFAKVAERNHGRQSGWQEFGPGYFDDAEITHWARIQPPLQEETVPPDQS